MYYTEEQYHSRQRRKQFALRLWQLIKEEFDDLSSSEILDVLATEVHQLAYKAARPKRSKEKING